jgi:hypothetical protein
MVWILIVQGEIVANSFLERGRTAMRSTFDLTLTEQAKPALDQIEPRGGGRCEVQMESRMARNHAFTVGVLCVP